MTAGSATAGSVTLGPVPVPSAGKKAKPPGCEEVDCETRIQRLEERWEELNNLPTNSEMFRRLRKFKEVEEMPAMDAESSSQTDARPAQATLPCPGMPRTCHPMSELWHAMQLLNQVETNTDGITRVRTVFVCWLYAVLSIPQIENRIKLGLSSVPLVFLFSLFPTSPRICMGRAQQPNGLRCILK